MAIFREIFTRSSHFLSNRRNSHFFRSFLSISLPPLSPIPPPYLIPNCSSIVLRSFLIQSRFSFAVGGPLFLSSPPWKLSQSSTPLLLQSDVVLDFLKLRALSLLPRPVFSYNVGFRLVYDSEKLLANGVSANKTNTPENHVAVAGGSVTDSYLNFPNYISFARLLSGPLLGWMIAHDMYSSAFIGLAISGATDWLDGYVARRMGINSVVGSYLDPLADKVLIGCVGLAMVDRGLLHPGLVSLVLLRDFALVGGAIYKRASCLDWKWNSWSEFFNLDQANAQKVEPLMISKLNTVFQLVLVAAALLQPVCGNEQTQLYINYLCWLVASTTVASTAAYGAQHLRTGTALMKSGWFRT